MADSYSQIYIHIVMVVKHRKAQIDHSWEEELYKYITGIVQKMGHKMLAINGMPDHIHIFINFKPEHSLSSLVREIKKSSNSFINGQRFTPRRFYWQSGYGAFSYSISQISNVIRYIERQKIRHRKQETKVEYLELLDRYGVDYHAQRLFDWMD